MNLEEIDKWLNNEYGVSYTRLEELHDFLIEQNMKCQDKIDNLQQENKQLKEENQQLKENLEVSKDNEETYSLEMQEITKILGLAEETLFDDVKDYAKRLKLYNKLCIKQSFTTRKLKKLNSILTELENWCKDGIKDELFKFDYGTKIIGTPVKIHLTSYEMVLDKIQKLKEDFK